MEVAVDKMLRFETAQFGLIEVDESKVVKFIDEIPGFQGAKRFVLIPHGEDSPFMWLQSIEVSDLAFAVTDPGLFFNDYCVTIDDEDMDKLGLEKGSEESIIILTVLTIPANEPQKMTTNLMAPIVINSKSNVAKQVILTDNNYTTKHFVLPQS